ncbi:unnamed protein product [Allacma fusca]|uniref:MRN complex-interacting protein N-terminal domain-containing protein n=1 Tax=Allacma fusca TaxID=39272 RepID=A0A8J2L6Q2_9HEXA|nr:unnamed protein product [Allacma fusca]
MQVGKITLVCVVRDAIVGITSGAVQIVKKSSNKWVCKVCNTKQSVLRVFGEGSGKDCRILVQQLNATRGQQSEEKEFNSLEGDWANETNSADKLVENSSTPASSQQSFTSGVSVVPESESKWRKYCESGIETGNELIFK